MGPLTLITFIPLLAAIVILFIPKERETAVKVVALIATAICLLITVQIYMGFDNSKPGAPDPEGMQFVEGPYPWIPSFNITYYMGVDGLSAPMVMLTTLLCFICIVASWNIKQSVRGYFSLFLLLDTGMVGVFCSLDFFLFYIFWEVMLLPMYFLIGIWGSSEDRREYSAIKFFLYTLLGSVLLLLAMLALYLETGTFNMLTIMNHSDSFGRTFQIYIYLAMFIGFAIKVPIFPFHTWLPDAHVAAPTAVSVILAGVLLKMGTYGIFRFNYPMLPEASQYFAWMLAILGAINIIYGALCAMAQTDLKKLVAYSSISHMGISMLGMAALTQMGMVGGLLQMFNHGTITAMMFLLVGVVYDRVHHRQIDNFGGLRKVVPIYSGIFSLAFFAALGLPGLSGFIGEAICFLGAFPVYRTITIVSLSGVVLTAGYVLWMLQRVMLGPLNPKYENLTEINGREIFTLAPLGAIVVLLGVWPAPVLDMMTSSMKNLAQIFGN